MANALTINGVTYQYPVTGDENWGPDASNWASAVTAGMLQKAGGTFILTNDVDFGALFGLKALYYKSRTANLASAGQVRLANADTIQFRNAANSGNLAFQPGSADAAPQWNGIDLVNLSTAQTLSNKTIPTITGDCVFSARIGLGAVSSSAIVAIPTSSNPLSGAFQNGFESKIVGNSSASGGIVGFASNPGTANSAFTAPYVLGFSSLLNNIGAASTITRAINYFSDTISVGTNRAILADNLSFTGNWAINLSSTDANTFGGSVTAPSFVGAVTGNASTATKLAATKNINGVAFDGSADITVAAAAGTLTGATLASNVLASSLTSVGTLGSLTVTGAVTAASFVGAAAAGTLSGTTLASNVVTSSLTSVGTLGSLSVTGAVTAGSLTGITTGSAPAAGKIGEVLSGTTSLSSIAATGQFFDAASVALTAGCWDITASVIYTRNSATFSSTDFGCGISTSTGNSGTGLGIGTFCEDSDSISSTFTNYSMVSPVVRANLSGTTTYYAKGFASAFTGTPKWQGFIRAVRVA